MKNFIIIILLLAAACGPAAKERRAERKLAKLVKENPGLQKHDTAYVDTTLNSSQVHEIFQGEIKADLWPVDSLTGYFEGKVDSSDLDSLNQGFKAILSHSGDIDTTFVSKNSKVHLKKQGKKLEVTLDVVPDPVKFKAPIAVNSVNPPAALTWYENIFLQIGKTFGALGFALFLLILLFIIYRVARYISK